MLFFAFNFDSLVKSIIYKEKFKILIIIKKFFLLFVSIEMKTFLLVFLWIAGVWS